MKTQEKSLTHQSTDKLSLKDIQKEFDEIKKRLESSTDENKEQLLTILQQLSEFEFGRFLIKNRGVSGYWTYYIILGFKNEKITNPIENFILNKAPTVLATQERFNIFQSLLIKNIKSNSVVCSIPCGMMADLLTLVTPKEISEFRFVGIDLDQAAIDLAKDFSEKQGLRNRCEFFQRDAWNMPDMKEKFDVITSNGLNVYEADNNKVTELYKSFYNALRPGGVFIGSALSCPPTMSEKSEWDMTHINPNDLSLQKMLFVDILQTTWSHFRTSSETTEQLRAAGFENIEIHWDAAKIFYSFTATKSFGTN